MGIIRVAVNTVKGTLSDQWLESMVPYNLDSRTIMTYGVRQNDKGNKGSSQVITDGSLIQVGENQTMLLVEGGKIVDYTAESGYFEVAAEKAPSLLNGQFGEVLTDAFTRLRFAGATPYNQQVYYINTQEIRDIPFGTPNPINYFDSFYNAELYLRAHGYYSIRVTNPLLFYSEMASRQSGRVTIEEMQRICLSEFLTAFQTAIGKLSAEGERISFISSKTSELADHMRNVLDSDWESRRGFRVESVGISSISYTDESRKLVNIRNEGAMLSDPTIREGYTQGAAARGVEAAGSNPAGAGMGFLGVGMANQVAGGMFGGQQQQAPQQSQQPQQPQQPATDTWVCPNCGNTHATGNFCANCGFRRQATACPNCKAPVAPDAKFCNQCGQAL